VITDVGPTVAAVAIGVILRFLCLVHGRDKPIVVVWVLGQWATDVVLDRSVPGINPKLQE